MPFPFLPLRGKKARGRKHVAKWQQREKAALDRKFRIIAIILVAIAVSAIAAIAVISRKFFMRPGNETRAIVVNSGPPELLQPFICDLKGGIQTGDVRMFIRNGGN